MSSALAIPGDGRKVTACCSGHHEASDCLCCAECTTNVEVGRMNPADRATEATDDRERAAQRRLTARRAEQLVTAAAIDDCLRSLAEATANVVHQANAVHVQVPDHAPTTNRWFASGVLV